MNKEVHYEGWLIKSPPTKRIWRARWRRRWFTLKQGEIPEQFCIEYYTDRNCRKLKGVIDLDQCEQVDCGLRLENRKQKFQFMFDIKTPKRTYYLAADTEADMRDWVNCICQVCHLHDTKQPNNELLTEENQSFSANTSSSAIPVHGNSTELSANTLSSLNSIEKQSSTDQEILLRHNNNSSNNNSNNNNNSIVILEQPHSANSEGGYVNTEYSNRETLMSAAILPLQQQQQQISSAIYLNNPVIQQQQQQQQQLNDCVSQRLAVNTNGVVRKLPENLVLNSVVLPDSAHSVQPSPALSTASGPYIPISECFSGSPKFILDSNNPTTPLNNLDPKFYDTPRSHNNIGLNLTNDQSYSPKITNCGTVQTSSGHKNRSHRSDSDSESVFTDDDEWTHPLPLRENTERQTRPSDSSVENESFVLTYSQRFSKLPDDATSKDTNMKRLSDVASTSAAATAMAATSDAMRAKESTATKMPSAIPATEFDAFSRVFKNKNNLILDFQPENEKATRDMLQYSDTENTSPAIGPRDAHSFVEESYDIPRSHNLAYHNMGQLREKLTSPDSNAPIAASTPNLMASSLEQVDTGAGGNTTSANLSMSGTLPRPHFYTNAAPRKVEGNVFRYDFMEQEDLPPVNRSLKPKINSMDDKHTEEAQTPLNMSLHTESLVNKLLSTSLNSETISSHEATGSLPKPPSVDRKSKPSVYKTSNSATLTPSSRRSTGAPLSMMLSQDSDNSFVMETRTLPRQPRPNYAFGETSGAMYHQRTASAAAATPLTPTMQKHFENATAGVANTSGTGVGAGILPNKHEHKLQYFDLDVANAPAISRQSISVGNLHTPAGTNRLAGAAGLSTKRTQPGKSSSVVYNSVDFVKTEAFKRIREERKKKSEEVASNNNSNNTSLTHQLK